MAMAPPNLTHSPAQRASPSLLGVDVGYSERKSTTGLAWRVNGSVQACLAGSTWASRSAVLPRDVSFDLAALDAPLVPKTETIPRRGCEAVFYRGAFWNRCRPGMSHHGRGLKLREAGKTAAVQFCEVMRRDGVANPRALPGVPIVEAFPNTFLGVLLPAQTFDGSGTLKIRTRSDWLYEAATGQGALQRLLEDLDWSEPGTAERFARERDHDIRAALVCLLTAGFASAGTAAIVGDGIGGWFGCRHSDCGRSGR